MNKILRALLLGYVVSDLCAQSTSRSSVNTASTDAGIGALHYGILYEWQCGAEFDLQPHSTRANRRIV